METREDMQRGIQFSRGRDAMYQQIADDGGDVVEYTHPGTPPKDDPEVETCMAVWNNLNGRERREVFRTLYRSALAYERTGDPAHMTRLAESVTGMVRLESTTNLRQILRDHAADTR